MTRRRDHLLTPYQDDALKQLQHLARVEQFPVTHVDRLSSTGADCHVRVRFRTDELATLPGGLPIRADHEDVIVSLPTAYPFVPPSARVEHARFVGHPHVLQGDRLCLYLDPAQEWHPAHGVIGFLNRLWAWLDDGAQGRFDHRTALFHPVGGVLHVTPGTPTIVVRAPLGLGRRSMALRWLHHRTPQRLDLARDRSAAGDHATVVIATPAPLRYGAGNSLEQLCCALEHIGQTRAAMLHAVAMAAARNPPSSFVYFLLAVPTSESSADEHENTHLIGGRLTSAPAAQLRAAAKTQGPLLTLARDDVPGDAVIEWCRVSEERPAMTIRRDYRRPTSSFTDQHLVLWGCGGLGSWIGEFLTRAGARKLTLCDPAPVTGPLLVRQDYTETDIGTSKAQALADRLQSISDAVEVRVEPNPVVLLDDGQLHGCAALIDATVNTSVAVALGSVWASSTQRPLVARLATDRATSTLGLLTVTRPGIGPTPEEADLLTGQQVAQLASLEAYQCFWAQPQASDELNPTPGCSVPTFHGSAADLAAVSGSLLSLLGPHLLDDAPVGSHLIGLPHSPTDQGHYWISF